MNEWINEEIAELEQAEKDQESHQNRLNLIQQHTVRLWEDLKPLIGDAVNQINGKEKLRKVTGGLECQTESAHRIVITKSIYPTICMTVKPGPNTIDIERMIVINGANRRTSEQREKLEVDLDNNGHPFLKNKDGEPLLPEQAVRYIFRPFLHPELLEGEGKRQIRMS